MHSKNQLKEEAQAKAKACLKKIDQLNLYDFGGFDFKISPTNPNKFNRVPREDKYLKIVDEALSYTPDDSMLYMLRGLHYLDTTIWGDDPSNFKLLALADFKKMIELVPNDARGYALCGYFFQEHEKNFELAIQFFKEALTKPICPYGQQINKYLAEMYLDLGDELHAAQAYTQAAEACLTQGINDSNNFFFINLSTNKFNDSNKEESGTDLDKDSDVKETAKKAEKYASKAIELSHNLNNAYHIRSQAYLQFFKVTNDAKYLKMSNADLEKAHEKNKQSF